MAVSKHIFECGMEGALTLVGGEQRGQDVTRRLSLECLTMELRESVFTWLLSKCVYANGQTIDLSQGCKG